MKLFKMSNSISQQRPSADGTPRYLDSWHVLKETARYENDPLAVSPPHSIVNFMMLVTHLRFLPLLGIFKLFKQLSCHWSFLLFLQV